jgi:ActR/RegA family two-component response regulator
LAVLDLHLQDGSGAELITELRKTHPGITIALLTGASEDAPAGPDMVLSKGDDPGAILERLAALGGRF